MTLAIGARPVLDAGKSAFEEGPQLVPKLSRNLKRTLMTTIQAPLHISLSPLSRSIEKVEVEELWEEAKTRLPEEHTTISKGIATKSRGCCGYIGRPLP